MNQTTARLLAAPDRMATQSLPARAERAIPWLRPEDAALS